MEVNNLDEKHLLEYVKQLEKENSQLYTDIAKILEKGFVEFNPLKEKYVVTLELVQLIIEDTDPYINLVKYLYKNRKEV